MNPVTLRPGIGDNRPSATLYYGQDVRETLRTLQEASVHTVCTSPPYFGLRSYLGANDANKRMEVGLEPTPDEFVAAIVDVFREVKRVLRDDGTLWVNLGDTYSRGDRGTVPPQRGAAASRNEDKKYGFDSAAGRMGGHPTIKQKDLIGIPWRVAFALQADGWYLRQDIIWAKPNPMPESVTDRCTKAHEYLFLLSKSERYHFDNKAIMEPAIYGAEHAAKATSWGTHRKHPNKANTADYAFIGDNSTCHKNDEGEYVKNKRSVWTVKVAPYQGAHFATWPPELVRPMVLAGCPVGGTVLDPFSGSATTGMVALQERRNYIGTDLNSEYLPMAEARIREERPPAPALELDEDDDGVLGLFGGAE